MSRDDSWVWVRDGALPHPRRVHVQAVPLNRLRPRRRHEGDAAAVQRAAVWLAALSLGFLAGLVQGNASCLSHRMHVAS